MNILRKLRKYSQMEQIVNLYEDKVLRLCKFEKYQRAGKLLLASAAPGEIVCLISETGHIADLFNEVKMCRVLSVEFIGGNNAIIRLSDMESGKEFVVRNNDIGKLFFHDVEEADIERRRRELYLNNRVKMLGECE